MGDQMKCLVTGGAGFIGSAACRYLITCGYTVVNFDKLTYAANLDLLATIATHPQYRFYRGNICDRDAVASVFAREQPDAVMHLAAEFACRPFNRRASRVYHHQCGWHLSIAGGGARLF